MRMRRYIIIVILLTVVVTVSPQKLSVSAPRHVEVGEQFQIEYSINTQNVRGFRLENIPDGIEILYGPRTREQSSYQIVNGHMSSSSSVTYSFVATAKKKGSYDLPIAHVNIGGKTIISAPYRINASGTLNTSSNNGSANNGGYYQDEEDVSSYHHSQHSRLSSDNVFIKVTVSKKRVHEQEPILLTYKVYTIPNLVNLDYKMPELKGFHTQEIPLPKAKSFHQETLNGQVYNCVVWSQFILYPQITGKLNIPSLTFHGSIMRESRDPFAFITGGYEEEKCEIKAPSVTVQVDDLPTKPAGFSGGVGRFNISCQLNKNEVKAGDPVNLRLVVSGIGNLKLIKQPEVVFPKNWDKYDAKITDKTRLTANGVEGNMVYDILAVPRKDGTYTIEPVTFVYYDTTSNTYKTVQTHPLNVKVLKNDGIESDVSDFSSPRDEDIRPIKTGKVRLHEIDDVFFNSTWYWIILAFLFIVFGTLLYLFRRTAVEHADVAKIRGKNANKVANKHLRKANKLMKDNNPSEFYDEVLHALWGYVSDKLNMPVEQLSRDNISEQLAGNSVDEGTIRRFMEALDECEYERYAPGDAKGNMNKTFETAMAAITRIEDVVKQVRKFKANTILPIFLVIVAVICSLPACAITKNNADTEYKKGNYQQAIKDYEELLDNGVSYEIYYNLGNAYYRIDNVTRAILSYERALLLSPNDDDVRFNLKMAQAKTIDKITPEPEMFFVTWYKYFINTMSIDGWANTSIISIILTIMFVLAYLFSNKILIRKIGFFGGIITLLSFVFANIFAFQQYYRLQNKNDAVIISPSVAVKKSPAKTSSDNFVLHEGTKVEILDRTVRKWVEVRIADGREGWIETDKIEEV